MVFPKLIWRSFSSELSYLILLMIYEGGRKVVSADQVSLILSYKFCFSLFLWSVAAKGLDYVSLWEQ